MNGNSPESLRFLSAYLPNWPLLIWLVAIALAMGLAGGLNTAELIEQFNAGFGLALGEFALILLPSLILAAAMSWHNVSVGTGLVVGASPLAGAGMICASTAYAALSPAAGMRRLDVAFGAHAGFKLLYPAGPLIVATGLGIQTNSLLAYGFALLIPVWAVGALWARFHRHDEASSEIPDAPFSLRSTVLVFSPFMLLAALLIVGLVTTFPNHVLLDFITQPKGALILSATVALLRVAKDDRRKCLDTAIQQTGALILIIGIASAFGGMLTQLVPLGSFMPAQAGAIGIISLFLLAVVFKLVQGGSMVTFATVAPVAAPLVEGMGISPVVAVFSICAGSFVAILPNDSFYWLVRRDALPDDTESRAIAILAGGATLQAFTGLLIILLAAGLGLV
jgi:GntP family gluconate:H+ symporter